MNTLVSHMFHISINIGLVYNRLTLPTLHIIDSEHLVSHMFHISINIGLVYNRLTLPTLHIIDSEHFSHTCFI